MKSFRKYISEEVLPTAMVQDGNFDVRNEMVRDQINNILAGICSHSHITPYITLRKVSKALAYFSIILPKKTFMEGKKGVEVYEMMQFGDKMGMNDSGEFIHEVPEKYYLFFQFNSFMGMFSCIAKVVDKAELDKMLDMAEITMKECADDKVTASQRKAGREPIQPETPSTKKAVADSEKGEKAKDVNEEQIDELKRETVKRYEDKAYRQFAPLIAKAKDPYLTNLTPKERKTAQKRGEGLAMAANRLEEKQIDEKAPPGAKYERMVKHIKKGYSKGGLTKKEKGIAFATAWKAKKKEQMDEAMGSVKKASAYKTFKRKVSTQVKSGLGVEGDTKSIKVTNRDDPHRKVRRVAKDKFDPSKHVKV